MLSLGVRSCCRLGLGWGSTAAMPPNTIASTQCFGPRPRGSQPPALTHPDPTTCQPGAINKKMKIQISVPAAKYPGGGAKKLPGAGSTGAPCFQSPRLAAGKRSRDGCYGVGVMGCVVLTPAPIPCPGARFGVGKLRLGTG